MYAATQKSVLAKKLNISREEAERVLDAVGELMVEALLDDGNITIGQLLRFKLKRTASRTIMNNLTGQRIEVAGKTTIQCWPTKRIEGVFK